MSVTVANLIQGPGTLYSGTFSVTAAAEPADAAVNTTPAASAWVDVGGTSDGVTLEIGRDYAELAVDQLVDTPERRLTKREFGLTTNLAEVTLENLALTLNEASSTITTGSGYKKFLPTTTTAATQPTYVALLFDGYAPSNFRRRVKGRKMLSVDSVALAYKKADQTILSAKWMGHYVSSTVEPFAVVDQTA